MREEDPAKPGFWARVASRVPGKSPQACFAKVYEGHPTPAAAAKPPKPTRYLAAVQAAPKPSASIAAAAGGIHIAPITHKIQYMAEWWLMTRDEDEIPTSLVQDYTSLTLHCGDKLCLITA